EPRLLCAIGERLARNVLIVRFVGLPEVGGIRIGDCAVCAHPVHRGAGVQAAREGDADFLSLGKLVDYVCQSCLSEKVPIIRDPGWLSHSATRASRSGSRRPSVDRGDLSCDVPDALAQGGGVEHLDLRSKAKQFRGGVLDGFDRDFYAKPAVLLELGSLVEGFGHRTAAGSPAKAVALMQPRVCRSIRSERRRLARM